MLMARTASSQHAPLNTEQAKRSPAFYYGESWFTRENTDLSSDMMFGNFPFRKKSATASCENIIHSSYNFRELTIRGSLLSSISLNCLIASMSVCATTIIDLRDALCDPSLCGRSLDSIFCRFRGDSRCSS